MFKTFEEIKRKYPIGYTFNQKFGDIKHHYFDNEKEKDDFIKKLNKDESQEILHVLSYEDKIYEVIWKTYMTVKIDGYIFDGEYWYPSENYCENWTKIDDLFLSKEFDKEDYNYEIDW